MSETTLTGRQKTMVRRIGMVNYRTLRAYLEGKPVTGASATRIERALRQLGLTSAIRPDAGKDYAKSRSENAKRQWADCRSRGLTQLTPVGNP